MRPMRARGGGMFPPIRTMAARLAIGLIAASVLAQLLKPFLGEALFLIPDWVLTRSALWQLGTFVFLEASPWGILFGGLIIWSIGGALEQTWGSKKLLWFVIGSTMVAGAVTVVLSLLIPGLRFIPVLGGMVMTSTLWVAYGLSHGHGQTNFWGMPLSGNVLAAVGVGFVVLSGLFGSWLQVVPQLAGIAIAYGYVRVGSPSLLLLKFQSWRLHQKLKGRSKHLRVITKERNMRSDSDKFLH